MAEQQAVVLDQDEMCCSVCLDLLTDPVTTSCGHSYCMGCITDYWDQDDHRGVYKCPLCNERFSPRPVLRKNNLLAKVVEKVKEKQASHPPAYAGPGDVECDVCTGRKQRAVRSCLMCLASYCTTHLQPHYASPAFQKHPLVPAYAHLKKICSHHQDQVLEMFRRTDRGCVCALCVRAELQDVQQRLREKRTELAELQQAVRSFKRSAQTAEQDSERIFAELMSFIKRQRLELKELVRVQQRAAVSQAEGRLHRLEQEIAELKRREAEMKRLSHTEEHVHFLQSYQSLSGASVYADVPSIVVPGLQYFSDVTESVSKLREKLENILKGEWPKISTTVKLVDVLRPPDPKTRADFLAYSCHLSLDPNTANTFLFLSEGNRKVTWMNDDLLYPDHPERFVHKEQVLCREGLSVRCYWEVKWSGVVDIAVSYKDISRTEKCRAGTDSRLGYNNKSWSLHCTKNLYVIINNAVADEIRLSRPTSSRVGVYLDHRAGTLSFYNISETMTLIHKVQTTFTQPLYPAFGHPEFLEGGSMVELCELE